MSNSNYNGTAPVNTVELFSEVLLVEDEVPHAQLISRAIQPLLGKISHVQSVAAAVEYLQNNYCELILCDFNLPDATALDLLAMLQAAGIAKPIIILTSSENLDDAVSAMSGGAWDYLVKHFSTDLRQRFRISLQRVAERRIEQTRRAQLRVERDAFAAATIAARDGVAVLSSGGGVVFQNPAFSEFLKVVGADPNNLEGASVAHCLAEHDPQVAELLRQQIAAGGESLWSSEIGLTLRRPSEKEQKRYFELTLSSGGNSQFSKGTSIYNRSQFVLWVRDITRRKEQERFQRDLLSTTSHDLKGPLGAVLSSCELLMSVKNLSQEKLDEFVVRIASCARGCVTLIDELLSARRIQDGMLVVRPTNQPLLEVLDDVVLDFQSTAKAKQIQLEMKDLPKEGMVFADRIGIRRVLNNLLSNALKFTPKGGIVTVTGEVTADECRIMVTDTGPGIDPTESHVLFEKYGRLDRDGATEGTGLGLYVCQNIANAHGGRIELRSSAGVGSTFGVVLPSEKAAALRTQLAETAQAMHEIAAAAQPKVPSV